MPLTHQRDATAGPAGSGRTGAPSRAAGAATGDDRHRIAAFHTLLEAGDYPALSAAIGERGPFRHGALFAAVDHLLEHDQADRLAELEPLAARQSGFPSLVWAGLVACYRGDPGAPERLRRLAADQGMERRFRRACRSWAGFVTRRLFRPGPGAGRGPDIVQFWDSPRVPDDVRALVESWRNLAGHGHHLFDAERAADFLSTNWGGAAADIFRGCPHPAIQSDYFRLGYLAVAGGMYVDADARMRPGFPAVWPSMADRDLCWFRTHVPRGQLENALIVARPGSALMAEAFEQAGRRLTGTAGDPSVLYLAGPFLLTDAFNEIVARGGMAETGMMTNAFVRGAILRQSGGLAYKRDGGSWKKWQGARRAGG